MMMLVFYDVLNYDNDITMLMLMLIIYDKDLLNKNSNYYCFFLTGKWEISESSTS
jgi:hypothetical protein